MALTSFTTPMGFPAGYTLWPTLPALAWSFNNSTFRIDATGEVAAIVFRPPRTGNLDKFAARILTVGVAPVLGTRFSFQDVSLTTGLQDGTPDQFATIAAGSMSTGWKDPGTFNAVRAVTRGVGYVAAVIDIPTFTALDDITVGCTGQQAAHSIPYSIGPTAKATSDLCLSVALHYDDSRWVALPYSFPTSGATTNVSFDSGTTPDEMGLGFSLPVPARIGGFVVICSTSAGNTFEGLLYSGTTVIGQSVSCDSDLVASTSERQLYFTFESDIDLAANTVYRVALRMTSVGTDQVLKTMTVPDADIQADIYGGCFLCTRTDQGAWTDYNNGTDGYRYAGFGLCLTGFDNAGGGGLLRHPGMAGNLNG